MDCSDKSRFRSHREAKAAARRTNSAKNITLRPYACGSCGGWHLTSILTHDPAPGVVFRARKEARRLAPGQSLEDLAAQIRSERA